MKVVKQGADPIAIPRTSLNGQKFYCRWCKTIIEVDHTDEITKHGWTDGSYEMYCPRCKGKKDFSSYRSNAARALDSSILVAMCLFGGVGLALAVWGILELVLHLTR